MSLLVTGGVGFIDSNFVLDWIAQSNEPVINRDALTYAGNIENLKGLKGDRRHIFVQGDSADSALVTSLLGKHQPRAIVNVTTKSHVDRSIHGRKTLSRPTSSPPSTYRKRCAPTGTSCKATPGKTFGSFTSRPMKLMARLQRTTPPPPKPIHTNPTLMPVTYAMICKDLSSTRPIIWKEWSVIMSFPKIYERFYRLLFSIRYKYHKFSY